LYLLDGTPLSEEQQGYLATAQQELARVSQIAAQTLTFNRQRDIKEEAFVSALLDSVLVLYQGRLAGSQIVVERRYQNTAPFLCYPGELRQLFEIEQPQPRTRLIRRRSCGLPGRAPVADCVPVRHAAGACVQP